MCGERDVGYMDAQMRDKARSSPAVGLLRALRTHFASAPFSAPVADFKGGVVMPLTAKQLRPLRVRVRAVSGVWGMWVSGGIYFLSSILSEQIGVGTCIQHR